MIPGSARPRKERLQCVALSLIAVLSVLVADDRLVASQREDTNLGARIARLLVCQGEADIFVGRLATIERGETISAFPRVTMLIEEVLRGAVVPGQLIVAEWLPDRVIQSRSKVIETRRVPGQRNPRVGERFLLMVKHGSAERSIGPLGRFPGTVEQIAAVTESLRLLPPACAPGQR
jgi:hypothetical protein